MADMQVEHMKKLLIMRTNFLQDGGHVGEENTFACLKAAFDTGINFFDCAEGYAGGESERVMGRAIKHFGWNRNDIVVSTKVPSILCIC
jgi:aryl-alcohol dehydrogenase-like predicted oxidoreductase